jgi:hypothetical protein
MFDNWRTRMQALFHRSRLESDLDDELSDYIAREIEREVATDARQKRREGGQRLVSMVSGA